MHGPKKSITKRDKNVKLTTKLQWGQSQVVQNVFM